HAHEIPGAAVLLPAAKAHFGAQLACQPVRLAKGGGNLVLGAAIGGAVGEMPFIIGDDVADVGMVHAGQAVAQLRHEMRAIHDASPTILRTAVSKVCQSAICDFSACAPLLVSL